MKMIVLSVVSLAVSIFSTALMCHFANQRAKAEEKILEKLSTLYQKS